jgi:hypothetical protein
MSEALNYLTRCMQGVPRARVRNSMASVALARYTGQHLLSLSSRLDPHTRFSIILQNDENEQRLDCYQQQSSSRGLAGLPINLDFLRLSSFSLAVHLLNGEYALARSLEEDILLTEEELSHISSLSAFRSAASDARSALRAREGLAA